jgi:hypothetical protein
MNVTAHQFISRIITMSKYDGKIGHLLLERCIVACSLQLCHQLENPRLQNNATSLRTRGIVVSVDSGDRTYGFLPPEPVAVSTIQISSENQQQ